MMVCGLTHTHNSLSLYLVFSLSSCQPLLCWTRRGIYMFVSGPLLAQAPRVVGLVVGSVYGTNSTPLGPFVPTCSTVFFIMFRCSHSPLPLFFFYK